MRNIDLFEQPIRSGKVRENVYWNQYRNGIINIQGKKFCFYTIKEAISIWRSENPIQPA